MSLGDFLKKLFGDQPGGPRRDDRQPAVPPPPPPAASFPPPPLPAMNLPPGARFDPITGQPLPPRPAPKDRTLRLDAVQFAPLPPDEFRRQARGVTRGGAWFGRRDLIPPASDPRTLLIDRAMVGHGLITPEELGEIHRIGEQMDAVRPDLAGAHAVAEQAVQRDKAAREQLKLEKKAQAARKKAEHAAAVAGRKATDIVFLGRGVSGELFDRRSAVEKLQAAGLPVLSSPADVARALGVSVPRLRWLAFHAEAATRTHYVAFSVPKKSGGERRLSAPHRGMAAAQQWVLSEILAKTPTHAAAHGFVPGRSTVTNAAPHVKKAVVVNADLTDFFPTVTFPRVRGVFGQLGYSPAVATVLALLCTECPRRTVVYAGKTYHVATGARRLPQGACTSPALSNLVARRMDARLTGLTRKLGWTYTRYADDLSLSAGPEGLEKIGYVLARVRHVARDEGFAVNEAKTRVLRASAAQAVTGIVVNERPGVDRTTVRRLRAILHRAKAEGLAAQNRTNHPNFDGWVRGMIAYVSMVNPAQGKPLAAALAELGR